jgi:hypothetical protein
VAHREPAMAHRLDPPCMARVVPGCRSAHFSGPRSGPTTVFAVEQCELSATRAPWPGYLV